MRKIDAEFADHLSTGATTIARSWVVTRKDGQIMGFTDHDRPLEIDGIVCQPGTGMNASSVERTSGLAVDNTQTVGALSSAGITDLDIERGLFDGAEVVHWLVNWKSPEQKVLQFRGHLGEIKRGDGVFEAELRGLAEALNKPVGRAYLRHCDRVLGDQKCGFDLGSEGFFTEAEVDFVEGRKSVEMLGLESFPEGWFLHGFATWLSGENSDATGVVRIDRLDGAARVLELWEETRLPIRIGDRLRLQAGCDKSAVACQKKFDNFLNFRGFPHMPGEDWSVTYPVSGSKMDGGSQQSS